MSLTPAKIKAYLATIKEEFLDETDDDKNKTTPIIGVLKMELLLRGVLLQDDTKIWTQIQSSIGKPPLDDGNIPKPLLAGANIMAGRVTEACFNQLQRNNTDMGSLFPKDQDFEGILQRAKDIQDERWLILFQQSTNNEDNSNYPRDLLQVALGYFTTAALIQSDTPPMWKKVYDVWNLLSSESSSLSSSSLPPFEAQIAIENLSRIALSKGNNKRASELQLRLIQSCLNPDRIELTIFSPPSPKKDDPKRTIIEYFGDSVTQDVLSTTENSDVLMAEKAMTAIERCRSFFEQNINDDSSTNDSETLLYLTLHVQALMAKEQTTLHQEAQKKYKLDRNRSVATTSLEDCMKQCQKTYILEANNKKEPFEDDPILRQACSLRDTLMKSWKDSDNIDTDFEINQSLAFDMVSQFIVRLNKFAEIISHKTGSYYKTWIVVLEYILPILEEMKCQADSKETVQLWLVVSSISKTKRVLISTVASMLPDVYWMLIGDNKNIAEPLDTSMRFVEQVLSSLIHCQQETERAESKKTTSAVGGKDESEASKNIRQWKRAKAAALCFLCQDDTDLIYKITRESISASKRNEEKGYLGFLRCMISWSGWYQRSWTFCRS